LRSAAARMRVGPRSLDVAAGTGTAFRAYSARLGAGQSPRLSRSEVVATAEEPVADHPEQSQDQANHYDNDANCPENGDTCDESDYEEDYAENYHGSPLTASSADDQGGYVAWTSLDGAAFPSERLRQAVLISHHLPHSMQPKHFG
jgi:hypothetical protein